MRPKSLILLSLALGCGLVASLGINQVMSRGSTVAQAPTEKVTIFVAKQEIALNDLITTDMVVTKEFPKDAVHKEALTDLEQIVERRARQRIVADEPILETQLLPKGETARASEHISPGMRSVAIKVDATSTGGYLVKPGDHVDLMVYLRKNGANGVSQTMIKTFLQNVKVFAIDNTLTESPDGKGKRTMKTVTLEVYPRQAEIVTMATSLGRVTMSLRSTKDDEEAGTGTSVGIKDVLGSGGLPDESVAAGPFDIEEPTTEPKQPEPGVLSQLGGLLASQTPPSRNEHEMEIIRGSEIQRWRIAEGSMVPRLIEETNETEQDVPNEDLPPLPFPLGLDKDQEEKEKDEKGEERS